MRQRLANAIDAARDEDDAARLCTLRLMKAAIDDREREMRRHEDSTGIGDAEIAEILATMLRQREESVRAYEESGRLELAEQERAEAEVIRDFLPRPLSEDEAREAVAEAIEATRAESLRDMGAVLGVLKRRYPGRMDFCKAGAQIRSALR